MLMSSFFLKPCLINQSKRLYNLGASLSGGCQANTYVAQLKSFMKYLATGSSEQNRFPDEVTQEKAPSEDHSGKSNKSDVCTGFPVQSAVPGPSQR